MPSLIPEDTTQPGTHALVIGVSEYPHLEDGSAPTPFGTESRMEQLSAAARSASEFAAWLMNDYRCSRAPLQSLRVLLSPSDGEQIHPDIAALLHGDYSATRSNVEAELGAFKRACDMYQGNVAVVYVAGHGVQLTQHGAILLLHDFGDMQHPRRLHCAIDMRGVHEGMNHPNTARTQFWFVDACRQKPRIARRFESLQAAALSLDWPPGDNDASPLFLAATTGKEAYARVGGITLFNEGLMWALRRGVDVGPRPGAIDCWHVSVTALISQLPARVKALAEAEGVEQTVAIGGNPHDAVFHEYEDAPTVELRVELLPDDARPVSKGTLSLDATVPVVEDFGDWPMEERVDVGLYLLTVQAPPPFVEKSTILNLKRPIEQTEVHVGAGGTSP